MENQDTQPDNNLELRDRIIGLGEKSFRKSYYPELQEKLANLEQFKALLDQSNDPIFLIEVPSGRILDLNKSTCSQLDYPEMEYQSIKIYDLLPRNRIELEKLFSGKSESLILDTMLRKGNGEETPYEVNMRRVRSGNKDYVVAVARNVTDRRRAQEALRESEENFRQLADSSPMPMASYDADENITYLNKKFIKTFGYTINDAPNLSYWWLLAYPDPKYREEVREKWADHVEKALETTKEIEPMEAMVTCKDGSVRYITFYGAAIGKQKLVILHDTTESKQAEEALQESEEKFRVLADFSQAAILVYQGDRYLSVNQAAEWITGYSKEELVKQRIIDIIHPDFKEQVLKRALGRQRGEAEPPIYETKIITKSGKVKWVLLTAGQIIYKGKPAGVATLLDITERKQAEEELEESRQQAELYLDLMSHDITNMNQALMGYLEIMEVMGQTGENDKTLIANSIDIINRSTRLINDVKKLTRVRTGKVPLKDIDLGKILAAVKAGHSNVSGRNVTINYTPVQEYKVKADDLLQDVFENLVDNAIKHSTGPLTINIYVDQIAIENKLFYRITVEDNGPGIPDSLKKKIFKSLKELEEKPVRRGFGLFFVRTAIDHYHGHVWVEDRVPGDYRKGSKFVIQLQASMQPDAQASVALAGA